MDKFPRVLLGIGTSLKEVILQQNWFTLSPSQFQVISMSTRTINWNKFHTSSVYETTHLYCHQSQCLFMEQHPHLYQPISRRIWPQEYLYIGLMVPSGLLRMAPRLLELMLEARQRPSWRTGKNWLTRIWTNLFNFLSHGHKDVSHASNLLCLLQLQSLQISCSHSAPVQAIKLFANMLYFGSEGYVADCFSNQYVLQC